MSDLPSGTVTFLFTDIESSTRLWEQPHLAVRLLVAAEALRVSLRYTIESHDQRYHHLRVRMARAGLDEAEFAATWAEGQALSLEQAMGAASEESEILT